ncbi:hypothetical protein [Marinitoga lauensis]|nr:hypothetical protein [Marinitoga lauensis]
MKDNIEIDLNKSAGPATCALITLKREDFERLEEIIKIPLNIIGEYI